MNILILILSLGITLAIEWQIIPFLKKRAAQPIYEGGPSWHMKKSGTPTMGGIGFLVAISISLLVACILLRENKTAVASLLINTVFAMLNSVIGIIDDLTKLRRRENAGLKPYEKIIFQLIVAVLFLMARKFFLGDETTLEFSFGKIELGLLYYPLAILIILGTVNCANLTDGIDGLASSVALTIGVMFSFLSGRDTGITPTCAALSGGCLGFLFYNRHPAKIFMGDTGSLFLGSIACALAFASGNPTIILFLGIVYAIEGLSVILQVAYFKLTKKRLFKMAPLHHHLEKCGLGENQICVIAVSVTVLTSIIGFVIFGT